MRERPTDPLMMEALEWFVRLRDEAATLADRKAFDAWLSASDAHAAAWQRAKALWDQLDVVKPEFERLRRSQRALSRRNLLTGSVVVVGGLGGLYAYGRPDLFAPYSTGIGERRTFTLPDGSTVELGSYSAFSTSFTESERRVDLFRGEGFFDVAPDARRPFVVSAGSGETQALGTKFDVKHVDNVVTVTVTEHAVTVRASGLSNTRIEKGWQVSYGLGIAGKAVPADIDVVEAWRRDRIVFQDVPLRRVLAELERYRRGRIVLADKTIGTMPVTAIFDTRQVESALQTIADVLPVRVFYATGYVAVVYPRS